MLLDILNNTPFYLCHLNFLSYPPTYLLKVAVIIVDLHLAGGDPHVRQSCAGLVPGRERSLIRGPARQSLGPPRMAELTPRPGSDQHKPRDTEKAESGVSYRSPSPPREQEVQTETQKKEVST